jgi:hypothetical protein
MGGGLDCGAVRRPVQSSRWCLRARRSVRSNLIEIRAEGVRRDSPFRASSAGCGTGPPSECSTACPDDLDRPAIAEQSVPRSAADPRPERRSDDGQMIFEALPAVRGHGPDLGFRGAPLRNRTVDLLLTMLAANDAQEFLLEALPFASVIQWDRGIGTGTLFANPHCGRCAC